MGGAESSTSGFRIPIPVTGVIVELIDDECLAYHPERTRAFYLNSSAALIWGLCDGTRSTDDICRMIREGYPDAPETLWCDVVSTLAKLEENELVVFK